jgi:hypothetical protein
MIILLRKLGPFSARFSWALLSSVSLQNFYAENKLIATLYFHSVPRTRSSSHCTHDVI